MSVVRAVVVIGLLVAGLAANGCAPSAPTGDPVALPATVAALSDRLNQVVAANDRDDFDALFTTAVTTVPPATPGGALSSPAPAATADRRDLLWTNLRALASVQFEPATDPDTLRVGWTVGPQDQAPAWQFVGGAVCDNGGCGLRNLVTVPGMPAPIWVAQPMTIESDGDVAVVSASGSDVWLDAAETAQRAVSNADLAGLTDPEDARVRLVVEIPADFTAYQAVLGLSGTDFVDTGALTWVADTALPSGQASAPANASAPSTEGSAGGENASPVAAGWSSPAAAVRVVVNPTSTAGLNDTQRDVLLAHEGVHVATIGHPVAAGRTWVSEGVAEVVGLSLDADLAAQSAATAAAACRTDGLVPPVDAQFDDGDPATQQSAYAVGWQLITLLRADESPEQAERDTVTLWDAAPGSDAVLAKLATWSNTWCAGR